MPKHRTLLKHSVTQGSHARTLATCNVLLYGFSVFLAPSCRPLRSGHETTIIPIVNEQNSCFPLGEGPQTYHFPRTQVKIYFVELAGVYARYGPVGPSQGGANIHYCVGPSQARSVYHDVSRHLPPPLPRASAVRACVGDYMESPVFLHPSAHAPESPAQLLNPPPVDRSPDRHRRCLRCPWFNALHLRRPQLLAGRHGAATRLPGSSSGPPANISS